MSGELNHANIEAWLRARTGQKNNRHKVVALNTSDGNETAYKVHFFGIKKPVAPKLENERAEKPKPAKKADPKKEG